MIPAAELPPNVRALLELVFEQLNMGVGVWRLECDAQDGRVSVVWRHNKVRGTDLDEWQVVRAPEP
jgi:hypothetical protein